MELVTLFLFLISLLFVLLYFAPIICKLWRCQPINDPLLLEKLHLLAESVNFSCRGFYEWGILKRAYTAAIFGIWPRTRLLLFTRKLLRHLSHDSLLAIAAHEMGHAKQGHLLYLVFIFFGMGLTAVLAALPFSPLLAIFTGLLAALLYFRYVFGYFSRLFERQADLYVLIANRPLTHLRDALYRIGLLTGSTHHPSWHHYSISERIAFLDAVQNDLTLAKKHDNRVQWSLMFFLTLLLVEVAYIFGS
ncbi:MAG: M48 family metalloprotease [Chlamydiia bacterium]|nr:M48 family metalloprotease [Chlamydiia bacterium]